MRFLLICNAETILDSLNVIKKTDKQMVNNNITDEVQ